MKNILLMTRYTMREAMAKKVFVFFIGFSVISLLILALVLGVTDASQLAPALGNNKDALQNLIIKIQTMVSGFLGTLLIFLAVFSSANFISSMLDKGTADIFLSKPLSRSQLIWGKFAGGCLVFLINFLLPIIGTWLIISLKFDYFNFNFLWTVLTYAFTYAVLYALVILFGILTKSSVPGIMTAYFIFVILSQILYYGKMYADKITDSGFLQALIKGFYFIIPKTFELMGSVTNNLILGQGIDDFQPVISTFLFLILMLVSAIYFFGKKDY